MTINTLDSTTLSRTALFQAHQQAQAKLVDFAGWEMPIHYGSQMEEHHIVRNKVGLFDVSHMTPIDIEGKESQAFLRYLLANDVAKIAPGKALYSCLLNPNGGVIDDLIVYQVSPTFYRVVVNASTRAKDLAWFETHIANYDCTMTFRGDLSILAVQGPLARACVASALPQAADRLQAIPVFGVLPLDEWMIARTGYTGEDGFEIMLPSEEAPQCWSALLAHGATPCGLGARDTLRLEAGMNLYGSDMTENTSPLESGLSWTIAWQPADRDFIGKQALVQQKAQGLKQAMVGLVLQERGVLRNHLIVRMPNGAFGEITSGSFSPTLNEAIGLARVPLPLASHCEVEIRGKWIPAQLVKIPFVRHGQKVYQPLPLA